VVSDEDVHLSAGGFGLALEAHQEIEDVLRPVPPVHDISHLDEVRLAPRPVEVFVEETDLRAPQDLDEVFIVAVEIADGHDPLDARPNTGNGRRGQEARKGDEEQDEDAGSPGALPGDGEPLAPAGPPEIPSHRLRLPIVSTSKCYRPVSAMSRNAGSPESP
jgi:hypothetical protein